MGQVAAAMCCSTDDSDSRYSNLEKRPNIEKKEEEKYSNTSKNNLIWLRNETKYGEGRTPLTPTNAKILLENGYKIVVEKSNNRCIPDSEYQNIGCTLVESNSWITNAPSHAFILGLKELQSNVPKILSHRHIYYSHSFKGQNDAIPLLKRFIAGNGTIYDYEFMNDTNGKNLVPIFSVYAGKVGMAVAILAWIAQKMNNNVGKLKAFKTEKEMINVVKNKLSQINEIPKIIIIGALGRCGSGAINIAKACGITEIGEWDMNETKKGGPFDEIVNDYDIFVNCILLNKKIEPFITENMCKGNKNRKLTVICDVSCDASNPNNPVPVYDEITTVDKPVRRIIDGNDDERVLDVTAIDHLPSLLANDASRDFSNDLLPILMKLKECESYGVLKRAKAKYQDVIKTIE